MAEVVKAKSRRAFAVIRQSRTSDGSLSPDEQRARIEEWCAREGIRLVQSIEELDVSGRRPLDKRPGLREGVAWVEDDRADLIVVAYFDRLVRSLKVQAEVLERVELALKRRKRKSEGEGVVALDVGAVSNATAAQWLSASMLGMVAEYWARSTGERVWSAVVKCVEDGRPPGDFRKLGYRKLADGTVEVDEATAELVLDAFTMRADGETFASIAAHLRANGVHMTTSMLARMLTSRAYLGELHFGELVNLHAWPAIVSRELFDRVQAARAPRGRHSKSPLLLARLGVLRCGTCSSRMSAGKVTASGGRVHPLYRCQAPSHVCNRSACIEATRVDELVLQATERLLREVEGRDAMQGEVDAARLRAEDAQSAFSRAVRAFDGLDDEEDVAERLRALKAARDLAVAEHHELRDTVAPLETFRADDLPGAEVVDKRRAIRLAIGRVDVAPGRGAADDRLTVWPRGSEPSA